VNHNATAPTRYANAGIPPEDAYTAPKIANGAIGTM
jgi:hypothetical protein